MKYISFDDAMDRKVFSRDLREYVVPVRALQSLRKVDVEEDVPDQKEMLRVLFNRCAALTGGQICLFCGIREECDSYRSVMKSKEE